jgi:TonB-linked SusC/RagA family outer membrane protein
MDKYLLTASIRADGSSRFGSENRFGYFPSFALGWKMHQEGFMQDVNWLSQFKVRASWGQIGNDKIGYYPAYSLIQNNLNAVFGTGDRVKLHDGGTATKPENPNIKWERTEQIDLGFNAGVLEDKLTFEFDYFRKTTNDMLVDVPIVASAGYQQFQTKNIGSVLNSGIEFSATWKSSINEFNYGIGFNGTSIKNEVLSLGGEGTDIFGGNANGSISKTAEGHPIGSFYGYVSDGVFQNQAEVDGTPHLGGAAPGDIKFKDVNGDGVINGDDRDYIGSPIPDFIGGFYFNLDYKGFDFNLDWQFQLGSEIYNAKKAIRPGNYNFEVSYLDRWTGEGTSNTEPKLSNGGNNYLVSDRFVESADYLRLRNVQLGYSLSDDVISNWGISKLRFYISATNIWTITSFTGFTPEINSATPIAANIDYGGYPVPATFNLGLNLTF